MALLLNGLVQKMMLMLIWGRKVNAISPECKYNGINLPCFCCSSENGSITGALLKQMLKAIDDLNVFDQSLGLNPFYSLMAMVAALNMNIWNTPTNQKPSGTVE